MNLVFSIILFWGAVAAFRYFTQDYKWTRKKRMLAYFMFASVMFTSFLFVRSIVTGISIVDQIENSARAAEKWGNECTWLP